MYLRELTDSGIVMDRVVPKDGSAVANDSSQRHQSLFYSEKADETLTLLKGGMKHRVARKPGT